MADIERLYQYYPFAQETMAPIEAAADLQNRWSFQELADFYDIDDSSVRTNVDGKPIEYLHLKQQQPDNDSVRLLFAPMANGALSENIVMRAIRLFGADAPAHLFVSAGPAHAGNPANVLNKHERQQVRQGDMTPLAIPLLREVGRLGLRQADIYGYSLGASVGQAAARVAYDYGVDVSRAVLGEPVTAQTQPLTRLGLAFQSSGAALPHYIEQADSLPLNQATELARNDVGFMLGLARLSNIAIIRGLAKSDYFALQRDALAENEILRVTTAYGTASEMCQPAIIAARGIDGERTNYMPLRGMQHAGGDDIDLHAAIMLEGLAQIS